MDGRSWLLACALLVLALPLPSQGQAPPSQGVAYEIIIDCPGANGGVAGGACPIQAVDPDDAMGDPSVAVDPENPDDMIIASLHGGGDNSGAPSPKSRSGQVFTTFTSVDHGRSWQDNPFFAPLSNAWGEHPSITIDPYGHAYVGSLYSVGGSPQGRYDYVVAAQKFRSISDIRSNQDTSGDYNAEFIGSVHPGNRINQMWFVYNPQPDIMTMVWTEEVTPYSSGGGRARIATSLDAVIDPVPDRVQDEVQDLLDPMPRRAQLSNHTGGAQSVIGVVWTDTDLRSGYNAQEADLVIGPCQTSTNPVVSEDWLYVGCLLADEGRPEWAPGAEPGSIHMFRMRSKGTDVQYLGETPLAGGNPKLGVRSDGRIALMTTEVTQGELRLDAAYGQYDPGVGAIVWTNVNEYAEDLKGIPTGTRLVDSNIQDLIYREYSGVVHMVFKRVLEQNTSAGLPQLFPTIHKSVIAIDEGYGVLDEIDLQIGDAVQRARDPVLLTQSEAVFNDIADDFLQLPPQDDYRYDNRPLGKNYQREFFAVGNYGIVIFAEVIEITDLRAAAPPPPPPPPPPPSPAPAAASTPAAATAGALATTAILAGTVATAKRKSASRARKK